MEKAERFDEQCQAAAEALNEANVVLLVTGAGWSADSGLATYTDVAKVPAYQERGLSYADISQPKMLNTDSSLFYGFFGQSFNDYRAAKPHDGFDIVKRWRDDKEKDGNIGHEIRDIIQRKIKESNPFDTDEVRQMTPYQVPEDKVAGAFHVFTSNVDAHFYDYFEPQEIHDCHGNIELWQCSNRDCESGIWRAPVDHNFFVDPQTLCAPPKRPNHEHSGEHACIGHNVTNDYSAANPRPNLLKNLPPATDSTGWMKQGPDSERPNWPKCGHCQSLARPAIFMFGDFGWKYDQSQSIRWDLWRESVIDVCKESSKTVEVCVLEIGCGGNVTTCRTLSEQIVEEVQENFGQAALIRINPDDQLCDDEKISMQLIPIRSKGLVAVKGIDAYYEKLTTDS